jgi:LacI family transcriptional regulator
LFLRTDRPTALICGNDILATGALYGATASGLTVPDDITVVGIGDFKGSSEIEPALTTVRLPARRIGQEAGNAMVSAIIDPAAGKVGSLNCAPEFVERRSSAAAKGTE